MNNRNVPEIKSQQPSSSLSIDSLLDMVREDVKKINLRNRLKREKEDPEVSGDLFDMFPSLLTYNPSEFNKIEPECNRTELFRTVKAVNSEGTRLFRTTILKDYPIAYIEYSYTPEKYYSLEERTISEKHNWTIAFKTEDDAKRYSSLMSGFNKSDDRFTTIKKRYATSLYCSGCSQSFAFSALTQLAEKNGLPKEAIEQLCKPIVHSIPKMKNALKTFDKYYDCVDYAGNVIKIPVAAYAAVYANEWVAVPDVYALLDSIKQPIPYKMVIDLFKKIASETTQTPPIFNVNFRSIVQILALQAQPVSIDIIKPLLSDCKDIAESPYGITIGVKDSDKKNDYLATLEKHGFIISNITHRFDKYLIWVIGSHAYLPPSKKNLEHPDLLNGYWKRRAAYADAANRVIDFSSSSSDSVKNANASPTGLKP